MNVTLFILGLIFIGLGVIMLPERCRHCGSEDIEVYSYKQAYCLRCGARV